MNNRRQIRCGLCGSRTWHHQIDDEIATYMQCEPCEKKLSEVNAPLTESDGDEWKHDPEPIRVSPSTRAQQQTTADNLFAFGTIDLVDWRQRTERLSSVDRNGRILGARG